MEPLRVAIQGGAGSFNEEAFLRFGADYVPEYPKLLFALTSERTLGMVLDGTARFGQFAVSSSSTGLVAETTAAKQNFEFDRRCRKVASYLLVVEFFLLVHPDAEVEEIREVISHPVVIGQCRGQLAALLPDAKVVVGEGDLIDPAAAAQQIASGAFPRSVATVSSARIAVTKGLKVASGLMQDKGKSQTTFELFEKT